MAMSRTEPGRIAMATTPDPKDDPQRRAAVRRTVWALVAMATALYSYFIVKTFIEHTGA